MVKEASNGNGKVVLFLLFFFHRTLRLGAKFQPWSSVTSLVMYIQVGEPEISRNRLSICCVNFEIFDKHPGETPLDGDRVVMFLGRTSPAGWALRSVPQMQTAVAIASLAFSRDGFLGAGAEFVPLCVAGLPDFAERVQQPRDES